MSAQNARTRDWPAYSVEARPIGTLDPYGRNARLHDEAQVAEIAALIEAYGWTTPVLVDEDGTILAGHGRVLAARSLRLDEVPVIVARGWSEDEKRAYVLADNKVAMNATWDADLLREELAAIDASSIDLALTGFDAAAIAGVLDDTDLPADDDVDLDGDEKAERRTASDKNAGSIADRFGVVPFSVFSAAEGWWQDRKRAWLALGMRSEIGRGENALGFSDTILEATAKGSGS